MCTSLFERSRHAGGGFQTGTICLIEFVGLLELLELLGLHEFIEFIELQKLFKGIEMGDCGECSAVLSRFLFQESIESLIGETFRVPRVTILSCAITNLFFSFLLDLVKFTV